MAKKKSIKTRKITLSQYADAGLRVAVFLLPFVLALLFMNFILNLLGVGNFRYLLAGVATPIGLALIYRWRAGKWPTFEEEDK